MGMMDNGHHGGLIKVYFCDTETTIKIVQLSPDPDDVRKDLDYQGMFSIVLDRDTNEATLTYEDTRGNKIDLVFPDKDMRNSAPRLPIFGPDKIWWSRCERVLTEEWIRKYHGAHSSGSPQLLALQSGLFKGEYGGHGVELIHLLDGQGVKVTGDNNVPFNKVTFRVTCGHKVDIPIEKQTSLNDVMDVTVNKSDIGSYAVPDEEQEDVTYDFAVPDSMYVDGAQITWDKCIGRWLGEAQIAFHNYKKPSIE